MKRIIVAIIALLIATTFATAALIGYNASETYQEINMHAQYDEIHDTEITLEAPADLKAGEEFQFSGKLVDKDTGAGIPGKTVFVRFDGQFDPDCKYLTDQDGNFFGIKTAPVHALDTEILKARYAGD